MKFNLSRMQREVLTVLLDKYEHSKTYKNENRVHQSFAVTPDAVMPDYDSDYADVEQIRSFEEQLDALENKKLISTERKGTVVRRIVLNTEQIPACYETLGRKDKNALIREEISFYEGCMGSSPVLDRFCEEQIHRLESGHKPEYPQEEAKELIALCKFILDNSRELLERELSIVQFRDSKTFEKRFRSRICHILQTYGDYGELLEGVDDKREREQIILGEHNIYSNPSYVYIKGNATLKFCGLQPVELSPDISVAYSSESLERLERIDIHDSKVMTIENLTSFNRMNGQGCFYLFLSGYHNTVKQRLLTRIVGQNRDIEWFHFGDFDPDGFMIIEHLKKKTGIDFQPVHMGVDELQGYREYGRPMTENDRKKAQTLLKKGKYKDEMTFMLEQNCKIEQEAVSWALNRPD